LGGPADVEVLRRRLSAKQDKEVCIVGALRAARLQLTAKHAQALTLDTPTSEIVIVTTNVGHLSQFLAAELWTNVVP
jgi:hypothetical protein